jgi:hypothetical protein
MLLGARAAEFGRIVAATEITDESGRRQDSEEAMAAFGR